MMHLMARMICIASLVLMLAAAPGWAAEGWVELPGADIEFPDDSEWISLPNGALRDRDSGVLAVPLLMIEDGIPANSSERETMARALAVAMGATHACAPAEAAALVATLTAGPDGVGVGAGINPTVTLEKQRLPMTGNLV